MPVAVHVASAPRVGARTRTAAGLPVRLLVVRGFTSSDVCVAIKVATRPETASTCAGVPAGATVGIVVGPAAGLVGGLAPRSATRVRLLLAGGGTRSIPAHAGAWVAALGRGQLRRVTTIDRAGLVIAVRTVRS